MQAYVSMDDLQSIPYFKGQTLLAVKAPARSQLIVPEHKEERAASGEDASYSMYLRSQSGPIEAMLVCNEIGEGDGGSDGGGAATAADEPSEDLQSAMLLAHLHSSPRKDGGGGGGGSITCRVGSAEGSGGNSRAVAPLRKKHFSSSTGSLVRLSPPPLDSDYVYNLEENEGVGDLYEIDDEDFTMVETPG
jgi:hypothetical protein